MRLRYQRLQGAGPRAGLAWRMFATTFIWWPCTISNLPVVTRLYHRVCMPNNANSSMTRGHYELTQLVRLTVIRWLVNVTQCQAVSSHQAMNWNRACLITERWLLRQSSLQPMLQRPVYVTSRHHFVAGNGLSQQNLEKSIQILQHVSRDATPGQRGCLAGASDTPGCMALWHAMHKLVPLRAQQQSAPHRNSRLACKHR